MCPKLGQYSPSVPHQERDCPLHGRTMFAASLVGTHQSQQWRCMKCECLRRTPHSTARAAVLTLEPAGPGPSCRSCMIELSIAEAASGDVCGECS